MKKLISVLIVGSLMLFITACGNQTEQVVIPQTFFSEAELEEIMAEMEVDDEAEVTVNDDGDLVYEMPKEEYDEMMEELAEGIDEMIEDVLSDDTISAVKAIDVNDDYDMYEITVERVEFEESLQGMFILGLGISGVMYQTFDNTTDSQSVTFDYIDEATGDVYDTVIYPEALEDMQ
ncbi:hypothetical protein SAMN05421839_1294 [Halolactibacillus halophilus]|uniref:Antigen I/II N-terminal domain-containing protein n=1 Tax=Halolactibacillus halophilus TaxID=306540 RepID=A0A1I5REN4_9BACI|nr:hypothetical protein [Halolactibacillus halophilus]GEM02188.1 hypothetical protein HHA03_17200 [Halolactibacillus halophilus]SFP56396.1 hypothetical protein SAMN05421839_1294 [Halolactibacillus halophilus]